MPYKSNPLKFAFSVIITIILTLGLSISLQSLLAAWTAPSANPPVNNITDLIISGGLGVSGNTALGANVNIYNNLGIGTSPNSVARTLLKATSSQEGLRIISSNFSPFVVRNQSDSGDFFRINEAGRVDIPGTLSSGKLKIVDTETEGDSCFSGFIALDSNGSILSCQDSKWEKSGGGGGLELGAQSVRKSFAGLSKSYYWRRQRNYYASWLGTTITADFKITQTFRVDENGDIWSGVSGSAYDGISGNSTYIWVTPYSYTKTFSMPEVNLYNYTTNTVVADFGYTRTSTWSGGSIPCSFKCTVSAQQRYHPVLPYLICNEICDNGGTTFHTTTVGGVSGAITDWMLTITIPSTQIITTTPPSYNSYTDTYFIGQPF